MGTQLSILEIKSLLIVNNVLQLRYSSIHHFFNSMELVHIQTADFEIWTWCTNQFHGLSMIRQQTKRF